MKYKFLSLVLYSLFTIFLKDSIVYNFQQIQLLIIFSLPLIFLTKEEIILFLFFLLPFKNGLPFNYILIFALVILFIKNFKYLKLDFSSLFYFIIVILELFNSLRLPIYYLDSIRWLFYFSFFYFSIFQFRLDFTKYSRIYFLQTFIFAVFLSTLSVIWNYLNLKSFSSLISGQPRLGDVLELINLDNPDLKFITTFNSNELAIYLLISIFLLHQNKLFSKIMNFLFIILLVIFGFLTYSRTFLIGLILFIFLSIKKNFLYIFSLSIFTFLLIILFFPDFQSLILYLLERLFSSSSDIRGELFFSYFYLLNFSNVFFGLGIIDYFYIYNLGISSHNALQELFLSFGITGLVSFLFFISFLNGKLYHKKIAIYFNNLVPFIVFLIVLQFHQMIGSAQVLMIVPLLFLKYK